MNHSFDIYVINLDKDVARLEEITKALKPNHFTRIQGVYGKDLIQGVPETEKLKDDVFITSKYFVPKNVLGSCLSHRKAVETFLKSSKKDYALILEDDATPTSKDYMSQVSKAVENAPKDWGIIKLDSWPTYSTSSYTTLPSLLATAYIVNKESAAKILQYKVVYYADIYMWFYNVNIYNCPTNIFQQIWDEKNGSNNKTNDSYNPLNYFSESFNFKMLRLPLVNGDVELTMGDLTLITIVLITASILSRKK
uniref:Glycosyl transferase family 25 domain-containing protein n=1 Tax=viral metagenome TaxID=1070528 RepID=A0A6C0I4T9_9ZZZZ